MVEDKDTKPLAPLPSDCICNMFNFDGPKEGTPEHHKLAEKHGVQCRTLLGEPMHAYVTCRPGIEYAIITLSKFLSCPSDYHFLMIKKVTLCLRRTKKWGIILKKSSIDNTLPAINHKFIESDKDLPKSPPMAKKANLSVM